MSIFSGEDLGEFIAQCAELSARIAQNLSRVENQVLTPATINAIFRDVHTIKGSAQLFGFTQLGQLAHALETCLCAVRQGDIKLDHIRLNILLDCVEDMGKILAHIQVNHAENCHKNALAEMLPRLEKAFFAEHAPKVSGASEVSQSRKQLFVAYSGELMKTYRQSIGTVTSKFQSAARDFAKELGKQIELHLEGDEMELDEKVAQAVNDPLMHIVRNAIDHGIETPDERQKLGKPEIGRITIRTYQEGDQLIIEIRDDGRGLNPEKIIAKALKDKSITHASLARMTQREILHLIFLPGFSTVEKVTNVSGRGVGMDVVKTNIERIGGAVEIASQVSKGSTLWLKIPLQLASVHLEKKA